MVTLNFNPCYSVESSLPNYCIFMEVAGITVIPLNCFSSVSNDNFKVKFKFNLNKFK